MNKKENRAKGKLLLFGEHCAVYGYPAVGYSIPLYTEIIETNEAGLFLMEDYQCFRESIVDFIKFSEKELHLKLDFKTLGLKIQSNIAPGSGLGSSAALSVSLIKYLVGQKMINNIDDNQIWLLAHRLEFFFHGKPSGIDTGLALGKGGQAFYFKGQELPFSVQLSNKPKYLLFGTVPRVKSTKELVIQVNTYYEKNPKIGKTIMGELGVISESSIDLLSHEQSVDCETLGQLAKEAHINLKKLNISIDLIDNILDFSERKGSLGGKLSGAGGGGAFWFLAKSKDHALELKSLVEEQFACKIYLL